MSEVKDQSAISSTALTAMTETAMVERVEKAKFPKDLTTPEKQLLAVACITYGFDPIMHELTIFQGNPFVSVDGRYRKAQETGQLDGMSCRPANQEERKEWEIPDGDKFFRAECYRKDAKYPFVGWGRVFESEQKVRANNPGDAYKPTVTNPQRMAEKRAEVQALRKAFHIPLPSAEFIGTVDVEGVGQVVRETGQIFETKVKVEPSDPFQKAETAAPEATEPLKETPPESEGSKSIVDLDWLKESIKALQERGQTAYSDENLLSYMKKSYKNVEGKTIYEIASNLDKGGAKHFTDAILNALG